MSSAAAKHPSMPLDAHLGLILAMVAMLTCIVLTVLVFVRNRSEDRPPRPETKPDERPEHPG